MFKLSGNEKPVEVAVHTCSIVPPGFLAKLAAFKNE
jgi:hypothetical protein